MNRRQKRWVFTCNDLQDGKFPNKKTVAILLEEFCEEGIVGLEIAPTTARLHYQGRLTIKGPRQSKTWLLNKLSDLYSRESWTVNPEIDQELSIEYCKKGNDYLLIGNSKPYGGKDMEVMNKEKRVWQEKLERLLFIPWNHKLSRNVYVLYDPKGNTGKSTWLKYYGMEYPAIKLPTTSVDRLLSMVIKTVNSRKESWSCPDCFIDLTRTTGKDLSYDDLHHAVEEIKSGWLVDVMYGSGTQAKFDPPPVVIFTNKNLQKEFEGKLSTDRWVFLEIFKTENDVLDLIRHNHANKSQSLFNKKEEEAAEFYPWIKTRAEILDLTGSEQNKKKNIFDIPGPNINESVSSRFGSEFKN